MFKLTITIVLALAAISLAQEDNAHATNLKYDSISNPDGSYNYVYETSNKISAHESGVGGVSANGGAEWVDNEGTPVQFTYTADENGYRAEGSHVPEVPKYVLELVEWLKANPSDDDGSYKADPPAKA